jgi:hypothetical protein
VCLELLIATAFAVLAPGLVTTARVAGIPGNGQIPVPGADPAAQPAEETLELESRLIHPGLPLAESDKWVFGVFLKAEVVKKGSGRGTLVLEPNAPSFDEFNFRTTNSTLPPVRLECTVNLVKTHTFVKSHQRLGAVRADSWEEEWRLYQIQGPKITSRLFLAMRAKSPTHPDPSYRLLIHDKDGKVKYAVDVAPPPPQEPCHPGCFPAGTAIQVPGGTTPIESVHEGDLVTTVGPGGAGSSGKVASVFVTRNRIVELRTDAGNVLTTETQPFCLAAGGLRAAGELKPGDRIYCWDGGKRRAAAVQSMSATGREQSVFNLILGDPSIFIANGLLVRSKPPAPAAPGWMEGVYP